MGCTMSAETSREGEADSDSDADDKEFSCPTCGDDFSNQRGVKIHHKMSHNESIANTVECDHCGEEIKRAKSHAKKFENQFCNNECQAEYITESGCMEGENNPVYNSVTLSCEWCNASFSVPKSIADRGRRFCGISCKSEWVSDEFSGKDSWRYVGYAEEHYGKDWDTVREQVKKRDKNRCQSCGVSVDSLDRDLDIHHIMPLREFDSVGNANSLDNLVALCGSCHSKWEGIPLRPQLVN